MITCKQMLFINFFAFFFVQSVIGNLCAPKAADTRTRWSHLWLLRSSSKVLAPKFTLLALHPLSPLRWVGLWSPPQGWQLGTPLPAGIHMVRARIWHRSVKAPGSHPRLVGGETQGVPSSGTPSTFTIAPLRVPWGCAPAPVAAGPSVDSLELPHSHIPISSQAGLGAAGHPWDRQVG